MFDSDGKHVLAESRDLPELRERFGKRAAEAFARHAAQGMAKTGLIDFPIQPVPPKRGRRRRRARMAGLAGRWRCGLARRARAARCRRTAASAGVRRLLAIALADKLKQARRQLPVPPKTSLLYAAIESASPRRDGLKDADRLRADLVDGAFAALAADGLLAIRDADAFAQRRDAIGKGVFAEAMRRLQQAEAILGLVAEVRAKLESKLTAGRAPTSTTCRRNWTWLVPPGFLRDMPADVLADYPRYLKAMALRAERAQRDPVRDQQRMLELAPFITALATADPGHPEARALRWELEELRVQLFAQELGAKGGYRRSDWRRGWNACKKPDESPRACWSLQRALAKVGA